MRNSTVECSDEFRKPLNNLKDRIQYTFHSPVDEFNSMTGKQHNESRKLYNQAGLYRAQELNENAEAFYIQSIALAQKEFGEKHPQVAQSMYGLAVLYDLLDDKRADAVYKKAKLAGANSPDLLNDPGLHLEIAQAYCLRSASSLMERVKKYDDAEFYLHKVESMIGNILGPDDMEMANTLFCLSKIYDKQGKAKDAEKANNKGKSIKEQHARQAKPTFNRKLYNMTQAVRRVSERAKERELSAALWLNHLANIYARTGIGSIEQHSKTLDDIKALLEEQINESSKQTGGKEKKSAEVKGSADKKQSAGKKKSTPKKKGDDKKTR